MKSFIKRGFKLSGITLGTVQLGKNYGISNHKGKPDVSTALQLLDAARQKGIHVYDTAQNYGDAERILGEYFQGKKQEQPIIMSKINIDASMLQLSSKGLLDEMTLSLEATLDKLKLSCLPILFIHNTEVMQESGGKIRTALQTLIKAKLIGKAGISLSGISIEQEFEHVWPWLQDEVFEAVQIPINVMDNRLLHNNYLARMKTVDKIVFARSVFLQGLILMNIEDVPSFMQPAIPFLQHLDRICLESGLSRAQLAFSFVRDLPEVDSILIGVDSINQLEDNLALLDGPGIEQRFLNELYQSRNIPDWIVTPYKWQFME